MKSRHSAFKSTVSEYVQKSKIHGVAYVGDDKRNKFERLWWFVMLIGSVFGACYLIYQSYRTMKENPLIESPSLIRAPTWEVPFPAVTFCPVRENGSTRFHLDSYNVPGDLREHQVSRVFVNWSSFETLFPWKNDKTDNDIFEQVFPKFLRSGAYFSKEKFRVTKQNTITQLGPCVTYNMYPEKDILRDGVYPNSIDNTTEVEELLWSRDSGFSKNIPLQHNMRPFRSFGPDYSLAMGFHVKYSYIRRAVDHSEYAVSIHPPDEFPQFGRHSEIVSIVQKRENYIEITPHLLVSEGIENYAPETRQCYYNHERQLKFYKNYTRNHCETECLADYILTKCKCVPYHLPHFNHTKLCATSADGDTSQYDCFRNQKVKFFSPNFMDSAIHAPVDDCKCLQSCTELKYKPVLGKSISDSPHLQNYAFSSTQVHIHNKHLYITKHVCTELHSISEFFSDCGGSLGLFLGVSIFSIAELLYFCTIRLYLNRKKLVPNSNE